MTMASTPAPLHYDLSINDSGGYYQHGKPYDIVRKQQIAVMYERLKKEAGGGRVSHRTLARAASVSHKYAGKIIEEVKSGELINPTTVKQARSTGAGSKTLDIDDEMLLLRLRMWQPSMTLRMYQSHLFQINGTTVHESVISRWFHTRYSFKASFRKPNLVPIDKFKPANVQRAYDFVETIRHTNPFRLKFGDEKHLKGAELFTRYGRRDPLTGEVPEVITDSDFRNTYNITGLCGIDSRAVPVFYNINDNINDSESFAYFMEDAVACGFLQRWDILVLDNASIHVGGENANLEDWLWDGLSPWDGQPLRITLLLLPARSPEMNPTELVWAQLVKKLRYKDISGVRPHKHSVAMHASEILQSFTFADIGKCYKKCKYLPANTVFDE
jgi:transposase